MVVRLFEGYQDPFVVMWYRREFLFGFVLLRNFILGMAVGCYVITLG